MFRSVRSGVVVAAVACGVLAGPIGIAQASNSSIVATFRAANGRLNRDEATASKRLNAYKRDHRAKPLVSALRHEVGDIRALNRKLKGERASTAKGRRGKASITKGLSLIGNAYSQLANEIQRAHAGHPVSQAQFNATVATDRKGRNKLIAGLRLLGVKVIA